MRSAGGHGKGLKGPTDKCYSIHKCITIVLVGEKAMVWSQCVFLLFTTESKFTFKQTFCQTPSHMDIPMDIHSICY